MWYVIGYHGFYKLVASIFCMTAYMDSSLLFTSMNQEKSFLVINNDQ